MAVLRLKLLIAYDGRPFRGWQSQASGDAVQDFIEAAFVKITGTRVTVHGAGRTDAGVHALGQVAHVDLPLPTLAPGRWAPALNANLPAEIRILRATRASHGFHARFGACGKVYTYRIWNASFMHPLELGRAWHMPTDLDFSVIKECAAMFVGEHDFAGFAANRGHPVQSTVRKISSIRATRRGPSIVIRFQGTGFLYKMVRMLTGTIVRCGQGKAEPTLISDLLDRPGAAKTNWSAPADGLYLTRVLYPQRRRSTT